MTELYNTCLGCQAQENPNFHGSHRCPQYVDKQNPRVEVEITELTPEVFAEWD